MQVQQVAALAAQVRGNVQKVIVGKTEIVDLLLTSMLAGGHVLLEDVPGTGKTMLAKALSRSLDCAFSRIQFTPDLLPGDITGMSLYNQKTAAFEFRAGPVFTNVLLADEINRATPRTQSALLESMEEHQITTDGVTRTLSRPFLVIATQNPVETQGTFPLPEAQMDRFLMRTKMGYPEGADAVGILERFVREDPLAELAPVASAAEIVEAQVCCKSVAVSRPIMGYISALAEATRTAADVLLGASPRGMLALMRAAQALAALRGRSFVTPEDVRSLAVPVLAHRLVIRGGYGRTLTTEDIVATVVRTVPVPTEGAEESLSEQ